MIFALGSLFVIIVFIYLLAIITDSFFVISLNRLAKKLQLPHNVAGASLIAMGASAPEMAIAFLALFKADGIYSTIGIGTIIGSAVFNILVISGVSAIVRPAQVTWRVVVRDIVIYLASIALLLIAFSDRVITLIEALAFVGLYAIYIYILFQWEAFVRRQEGDLVAEMKSSLEESHHDPDLYHTVTTLLRSGLRLMIGNPQTNLLRSISVSLLLIGLLSWYLIDVALVFAAALGVPPVIVALTVLAGGTSLPGMVASIVMARQGRGEMAIANAVGANIFIILVGLGLPWLIAILLRQNALVIDRTGLWTSTVILLATILLLYVFLSTERLLSRKEGWTLLGIYGVYVAWIWLGG